MIYTPMTKKAMRLAANPIAKQVKLADLDHNSDISRLDDVTDKAIQRIFKYQQAVKILIDN